MSGEPGEVVGNLNGSSRGGVREDEQLRRSIVIEGVGSSFVDGTGPRTGGRRASGGQISCNNRRALRSVGGESYCAAEEQRGKVLELWGVAFGRPRAIRRMAGNGLQ